jgi:hypothetical protein
VKSGHLADALSEFHRRNTVSARRKVLEALASSELIFPAAERREQGGQGLALAFAKDRQGHPVLPGFTDERHLREWLPTGGPHATAPAVAFLPTVLAGPFVGLVINPGSPASAFVDRRALELLAAGKQPTAEEGILVRAWEAAVSDGPY